MGHRANFVVIRNGNAVAFHDQWAALGSTWAFAGGPDEAVAAAEASERTTELLDWAFAEAGYLIDFDKKEAIVFGYPEMGDFEFDPEEMGDLPEEEVSSMKSTEEALQRGPLDFLQAIAPRWRSWNLHWDDRGVDAFAAYLSEHGFTSIAVPSASHPGGRSRVSFQT